MSPLFRDICGAVLLFAAIGVNVWFVLAMPDGTEQHMEARS